MNNPVIEAIRKVHEAIIVIAVATVLLLVKSYTKSTMTETLVTIPCRCIKKVGIK